MSRSAESLQARLFWAFALVTVIAAALPALFSRSSLYEDRLELVAQHAKAQVRFAGTILASRPSLEQADTLFAAAKNQGFRLTLIDTRGRVVKDSHVADSALNSLDSHEDRPEVESLLSGGTGTSLRRSAVLGAEAMYATMLLPDGKVLRAAVPLTNIKRGLETELSNLSVTIAGVAGFCLLLSVAIAARIRRGISGMAAVVQAISLGQGPRRLHDVPGREFLPLARAVNRMADDIEDFTRTTLDQRTQLETILNSMREGLLVLGPSGAIRRYNKAMAALFPGVRDAEGKQLIEAVPVPVLQTGLEELIAGKRLAQDAGAAEIHFECPPGRFLVAHLARPEQPDETLGAVIVFYNATEIMRLERVRRDFAANVSHELRTPLTAISGYAEALMELDGADAGRRNFARIIHKHAAHLTRVINDLLRLSRIENAEEKPELTPIRPEKALEEAVALCKERAKERELAFAARIPEGTTVLADCALLAQVFRNLLENACRYSPIGETITIRAEASGKEVLFAVEDKGPGIPSGDLARIFERFYQVDKQRNGASAGIGLAICKHIVERHGGRIWAESPHQGGGTAVFFTLPAAPLNNEQA